MSKDLNQCNFIGRIGKDIEVKYMPDGKAVVNLSIAVGDDYKDQQGNKVERTNWVAVVMFGKLAEIVSTYCGKGSKIFVSGKFTVRKWQDKDGQDRYTTEIVGNELQMLDGKPQAASQPSQSPQSAPVVDDFDDDIPW